MISNDIKDENIERFERYMKKYPDLYAKNADIVKENIVKEIKKPKILDLGCGPGLLVSTLEKKNLKGEIFGVDISEKMLKIAKTNTLNSTFLQGSAEKIPIDDCFADVLVSRFSLPYWKNPNICFKEIYRVVKPGGRVVFECLNKDFSKVKLFFMGLNMSCKGAESDIVRYHVDAYKTAYCFSDVEEKMSNVGFKMVFSDYKPKFWKFIVIFEKGEK